MKNLIFLLTICILAFSLSGCGASNNQVGATPAAGKTTQAAPANITTPTNSTAQTVGTPATRARNTPQPTNSRTPAPQPTAINFSQMTDEQINKRYDELRTTNPTQAESFGRQVWASKFPGMGTREPDKNSWSLAFIKNNNNNRNQNAGPEKTVPTLPSN